MNKITKMAQEILKKAQQELIERVENIEKARTILKDKNIQYTNENRLGRFSSPISFMDGDDKKAEYYSSTQKLVIY